MFSPLLRQLVRSLRAHPERWSREGRAIRRDDGVEISVYRLSDGRTVRPRLSKPREVEFGYFERLALRRAIHWWKHRPLDF